MTMQSFKKVIRHMILILLTLPLYLQLRLSFSVQHRVSFIQNMEPYWMYPVSTCTPSPQFNLCFKGGAQYEFFETEIYDPSTSEHPWICLFRWSSVIKYLLNVSALPICHNSKLGISMGWLPCSGGKLCLRPFFCPRNTLKSLWICHTFST